MGSIHEVIDAFRQAPSNSERGTKFEKLMVRYFELDPMLAQRYESVCRWIDWDGRDGKPDTGIDLVARDRATGEMTAIQCKFYEPAHQLSKGDIDSYFTALGKAPFTRGIIISTTDRWGKNAEDALDDQSKPVQRIGLDVLAESPIDWQIEWADDTFTVGVEQLTRHKPKDHQQRAIDKVFVGFAAGNDRGKLIMACGTGKTFTALQIAERTATENGGRARIVFCVPSISLLSQTLREWTAQASMPVRAFAVCSDQKVSRAAEDSRAYDVAIPVTTDSKKLTASLTSADDCDGLTVVFTTYQSLPVVSDAQANGLPDFDLVLCDEAHRTTGVTLTGADESNFVKVHDPDFLKSARRLYLTATPRIYDQKLKDKAEEHSAEVASMDNEELFGPEFHHLGFGEAVEKGLLTDYKVLVLTVDQSLVAGPMQEQLAGPDNELSLDDATRIVGCWNGLAKRAGAAIDGSTFSPGENPMRRAVAFARDIASSKSVAGMFPAVVDAYRDTLDDEDGDDPATNNTDLYCTVEHVDGTYNALERTSRINWLKGISAPLSDSECRILTNARCLSEGVDVPALDAVLFLHPRNSIVDVVQAVGRVMRLSEGKDYGYIILPVAVPAEMSPSEALQDNKRFKVVWEVLNALRSHDERFDAHVNAINLNTADVKKLGTGTDSLMGGHIGPAATDETETIGPADDGQSATTDADFTSQLALFSLSQWRQAIFARIVDKVGTRTYWEDWAHDVADISAAQITRIKAILAQGDPTIEAEFGKFVDGLRDNLNDSISTDDAISMLSQHLITKPVFDALFSEHDFASHNPVSIVMQRMIDTLGDSGLESETASLDTFYDSVRLRASQVTSAEGKQRIIADLYERFFKIGFAKQATQLGIVYTPVQVVDWILHAADTVSREHFGKGLTDDNVHILDPFTGTGTFLTRLMQTGLVTPHDLARKYTQELHANEIMLLAYYVAAVNIEATYHALVGKADTADYQPFPGIVLADTFQISEADDTMDAEMFPANNDRITRQLGTKINVIIGNPPYSVGQDSANDNNANIKYPTLDGHIKTTYAARSTARNKNSLYDSYYRAFRWATDRIGDQGIVAFVSNGGWIDGNTPDGVRLTFAAEYSAIYVYNLRGNMKAPDWKAEGGQIFGAGSQTTIAIFIGVKDPSHTGPATIHYRDVGDYLTRDDKLRILDTDPLPVIDWVTITPNAAGDWINHRDATFSTYPAIGDKKATPDDTTVFRAFSAGLQTNRDAWVYNYSRTALEESVQRLITNYNATLSDIQNYCTERAITKPTEATVTDFLKTSPAASDPTRIKWARSLRAHAARGRVIERSGWFTTGTYRPFDRQHVYFDRYLNHERSQLPTMFPTPHHANIGIVLTAPASHFEFTPFATKCLPYLHTLDTGQFFPRYTYRKPGAADGALDFSTGEDEVDDWGYQRVDNISDEIESLYRSKLGDAVSKDDIFCFVYGLLHSPTYRATYAADLKKMLPRVPTPESRAEFDTFANAGRQLLFVHADYEEADPFPLEVSVKKGHDADDPDTWRVQKMKWRNKSDHSTIVYNPYVTISGIPEEAERYLLGSRTALGWIIERYQVKTDKDSKIVNDPNDWCDEHDDPTYIVDLIRKVTTVAVETMKIVDALP
ncbi:DEAD/DEAH box helicase [Gordonia sp. OPL2]|uniref:DEAD/DEAH box helicase n=1 Tax=Gordonia sp. OPL2 TaxID=2486274 RepID=UPI0016550420|nr:DEAD/DEAH box helicase [Gordonia sp. OPL2]RPA06197.1 damage-inducible protein [Gordonia sp. OPL2]